MLQICVFFSSIIIIILGLKLPRKTYKYGGYIMKFPRIHKINKSTNKTIAVAKELRSILEHKEKTESNHDKMNS